MNVGDLVRPMNFCAGTPGGTRCETALVINVELKHLEMVQVDSQEYRDKEIYECALMCGCGMFIEYDDSMELINESR